MTNPGPNKSVAPLEFLEGRHREAVSRSDCYGLLALVFGDVPTSETVARLRSPELTEALHLFGSEVGKDLSGELQAVTQRLCEEYTRVFVGPGPHVSPYASVYFDGEGQLWGESTSRVKRFIETMGLSFEDHWGGIPDHIAIELEVMQRLTGLEAELWAQCVKAPEEAEGHSRLDRCLELEEQFLRDHLGTWAARFCDHVLERTVSPLYRKVASLTKSIVFRDLEQVAAMRTAL